MSQFHQLISNLATQLEPATEPPVIEPDTYRQAAVALILREHVGVCEMLIIKRAERKGDLWSGNLALPGGRWDTSDPDLLATAVRETREEVGIDLDNGGQILGRLATITTRSPLIPKVQVTPFVAVAPREYHAVEVEPGAAPLKLNHEVAAAFWMPVDELQERGRSENHRLVFAGQERTWPAYPTEYGLIWGMTEGMLTDFFERMHNR
jgi:8-oxo-dGTP pyrophosphatase MutT (NUDIX family)